MAQLKTNTNVWIAALHIWVKVVKCVTLGFVIFYWKLVVCVINSSSISVIYMFAVTVSRWSLKVSDWRIREKSNKRAVTQYIIMFFSACLCKLRHWPQLTKLRSSKIQPGIFCLLTRYKCVIGWFVHVHCRFSTHIYIMLHHFIPRTTYMISVWYCHTEGQKTK